ncbi:protein FAM217B isoform X2 [Ctenopharyngodon idella]|uniref:protein FAM217B isoform X2 n=1 Tax=Ctenopharyngodon idella TaxID=7959 RepID=UPI00222E93CA|nr:protein FAM217B isoform X2 [Ctenopharyngodon idella]XP_051736222.1 protein FAM217B isoform X2 [Ctenopharyngodon idella]
MGPILQERTASATLKKVPDKEKVRMKNAENTGIVTSNNKRGAHVNQNKKPLKKTVSLHPGQEKDPLPKAETVQNGIKPKKAKSPTCGTCKLRGTQGESDLRPPHPKLSCPERGQERQKIQLESQCCREMVQSHVALEKSRRALSLPLAPQPVLQQLTLQKQVPDLESLRLLEHKEDDTDSASDLSDSERLPVLPSPCTPPQLNLRAEVFNTMDLHPHIPGPRTVENDDISYNYPDFLPPPFNTWSLRQLAIFLNTEGKRAPRPKPVGMLEKYLERLLQLEWHQIQTIQAESGQHIVPIIRTRGNATSVLANSNRTRPHTAPPTRLSSPKSFRQGQRGFFSSMGSPSSTQLSRPVCPHCHIRYPLCNGTCSSYAYQRHSRLSPLLERKPPPANTQKRSSSESRASTSENRTTSKNQHLVSPQAAKAQQNHMQAMGNVRRASHELNPNVKSHSSVRKGKTGRSNEAERQKDPPGAKREGVDRRVPAAIKREGGGPGKKMVKDCPRAETGEVRLRSGTKRMVADSCDVKVTTATKTTGKVKNAQYAK